MYKNLVKEMKEAGITQGHIAKALDRRLATISDKVRGVFPFSLPEAMAIRDQFFPEMDLDYLFESEEE